MSEPFEGWPDVRDFSGMLRQLRLAYMNVRRLPLDAVVSVDDLLLWLAERGSGSAGFAVRDAYKP